MRGITEELIMTDDPSKNDRVIAKNGVGTVDEPGLAPLIGNAWRIALSDPKDKAEIAALLGAKQDELDPDRPPFTAEIAGAGFTGAEVLIAVAVGFVTGVAKDLGSAAGKGAAKQLREIWEDYMRDRVSPPGSGKLGAPKDEAEQS
jgi:hypothetical protein